MLHIKDDQPTVEKSKNLIRKIFLNVSSDKKIATKSDIKTAWIYLFGYKISKFELQEYFEKLGKDYHNDGLTCEEFETKAMSDVKRLDSIEEMRNAFIALDFSCKGFLTIDDLIKQFQLVAPHMSAKRITDIFKELDRDGDERVSYKDFEIAMEYINDDLKTINKNANYFD